MKRTISTLIGLLALLTGGLVATTGVALAAPATPYVVAVWSMPTYAGPNTPTWPQTLVAAVASPTASLGAADGIIPSTCGKQYQVDVYVAGDTTTSLISGGVLTSPNHPAESFPPGAGWGTTYKIVKTDACPPELITVTPLTPDVTPPTCTADGTLVLPTGPEGVKYVVKPAYTGPGEYTITAKALKGYVLVAAEHEWAWDLTVAPKLTGTQCETTPPPPPVLTPGPANPQAKIVTSCGHAVFTLSNLTPQTYDESATFVTTINGKDSTAVTVKAGDTQELGWAPVADTGVYTIGVRVGDTVLATGTVESKCGTGGGITPKPPVTPVTPVTPVAHVTELPHTGGGSALPYAGVGLLLLAGRRRCDVDDAQG